MEPTHWEIYQQHTAKLLVKFIKYINPLAEPSTRVIGVANNCYGGHDFGPDLCNLIKFNMKAFRKYTKPDTKEAVELKAWWIDHCEVDAKREASEKSK
jgi:hypothetical protein